MSAHRFLFYDPQLERGDDACTLAGDEHHHATRVLRLRLGDDVFVTNGDGLIVRASAESIDGSVCRLRVSGEESDVERPARVTLALALIRRERFEQAVEQSTELGVTDIVPFRSRAAQVTRWTESQQRRLARVTVSAMKQSFRAHLPVIHDPVDLDGMVALAGEHERVVMGDPDGAAPVPRAGHERLMVVVGPEAGLAAEEVAALAAAGAVGAAVTRARLRAETAAVALLSALMVQRD